MKKGLSLILLLLALAAGCGSKKPGDSVEPAGNGDHDGDPSDFSGSVTLRVMLTTTGDVSEADKDQVTDAINRRIGELGYDFSIELAWSGGAWGFEYLDEELQAGSAADIIPSHTWSGSVTCTDGARTGRYLRLDDPADNLLEKYGQGLYTSGMMKTVAAIPGDQGSGIYAYVPEKDVVTQLGYYVNLTALNEIGFSLGDFDANDLASWEPLLQAYAGANPGQYPLNIEAEVLDRTVNYVMSVNNTEGPLGVVFDNADPAAGSVRVSSRYENPRYISFLDTMSGYYQAGYVDPDQGAGGEASKASAASRLDAGDFLISTAVYAPGRENAVAATASASQRRDIEIVWVPGWARPVATPETVLDAGYAVYAGTRYAPEAVTFLNMVVTDSVIGNLISLGVEGVSYELKDGVAWYLPGRWNIWRYGVIGCNSKAIPLGDNAADGTEWETMRAFNGIAAGLESGLFDVTGVEGQNAACIAVIGRWAVPLGSGAAGSEQYDDFITELKAAGVDDVVAEAAAQRNGWVSSAKSGVNGG